MKLYLKYLSIHLKSTLEYRATFFISLIGKALMTFSAMVGIYMLFDKFGTIKGYEFNEVLICFSVSYFGYAVAECFFRAFDTFDKVLSSGEFDRIMVRPRSIMLQVLGAKNDFSKFGRLLVALGILVYVVIKNIQIMTFMKVLTLVLMASGTIAIYASIFILNAGLTFFSTQGLEIIYIFTDGTRELAQYPLSVYAKPVRRFFTCVLPIALTNYYPLLYVTGRTDNLVYAFLPLLVPIFAVPCIYVWKLGVGKYKSVGS